MRCNRLAGIEPTSASNAVVGCHANLVECCSEPANLDTCPWAGDIVYYLGCEHQCRVLAGVLGDQVAISKDKSKVTVTTETAFSKRQATPSISMANHEGSGLQQAVQQADYVAVTSTTYPDMIRCLKHAGISSTSLRSILRSTTYATGCE